MSGAVPGDDGGDDDAPRTSLLRSHPLVLASGIALVIVGLVVAAVGSAVLVVAIGWALFGFGGVVLMSLAFLLVGESDDRDRAQRPGG
jgi:hypothetical protein